MELPDEQEALFVTGKKAATGIVRQLEPLKSARKQHRPVIVHSEL